jgi:hypothetical protein
LSTRRENLRNIGKERIKHGNAETGKIRIVAGQKHEVPGEVRNRAGELKQLSNVIMTALLAAAVAVPRVASIRVQSRVFIRESFGFVLSHFRYGKVMRALELNEPPVYVPLTVSELAAPEAPTEPGTLTVACAEAPAAMVPMYCGSVLRHPRPL